MLKILPSILQSREVAGILFGITLTALSPPWVQWVEKPPLSVILLVLGSMCAASMVGANVARAGHPMELAVRRGTGAGSLALLVAGAFLLWGVGRDSGYGYFRAWLVLLASVMPVLLAGTIAAGLGAWRFRREVTPLSALVEIARLYRWPAMGLIGAGFLMGAMAPWLPRPVPEKLAAIVPPTPVVERYTPPVREPFAYKTPIELTTAPPVAWKIKTIRNLGAMSTERGVAFSHDQRFLAWGESDSSIVVRDLESDGVRRISGVPYALKDMAFSPDGERLFVIMHGQPLRVGVGFLERGRFILLPQPKKYAVPDGPATWWKEDEVIFLPKSGHGVSLNLSRLELHPSSLPTEELEQLEEDQGVGFPSNSRWAFGEGAGLTFAERPEVEGTSEWKWQLLPAVVLTDLERASRRIFMEIAPASGDLYFGVKDGSKLMQVRNGGLSVIYFERGPVPPLRWKINMLHSPEQMKDAPVAQGALAKGQLSLLMYAPLVNPLNDKIVGPNRERPKAILRVLRWAGTEAEVWIEAGAETYSPGDVFSDLHVAGDPPQLLEARLPILWWVPVPEPLPDATDPNLLPLRKDLEIQREEYEKVEAQKQRKLEANQVSESGLSPEAPKIEQPEKQPSTAEIEKSLRNFILSYHNYSSKGMLMEMTNCYAAAFSYNSLNTSRPPFLGGLKANREVYKNMRENVDGRIRIKNLGPNSYEATYLLKLVYQKGNDAKVRHGHGSVKLAISGSPGAWQITAHTMDKAPD